MLPAGDEQVVLKVKEKRWAPDQAHGDSWAVRSDGFDASFVTGKHIFVVTCRMWYFGLSTFVRFANDY